MKKEKIKEEVKMYPNELEMLRDVMMRFKVSGILYLEGKGVITMFHSQAGKIIVLDEAKKQLTLKRREDDLEIIQGLENLRLRQTNNKKGEVSYVG